MEQNTIVEKILRSMAPKFNYVVYLIEQSNDVTTLSIEELQKDLVMEEVEEEIPVEEGGGEGRILKQLNATSATNLDLIKVLAHIGVLVPDLAYSVCLVARFMERPTEIHIAVVKRIM
ncbi:F-box protein, partial [Trifolium pratense]